MSNLYRKVSNHKSKTTNHNASSNSNTMPNNISHKQEVERMSPIGTDEMASDEWNNDRLDDGRSGFFDNLEVDDIRNENDNEDNSNGIRVIFLYLVYYHRLRVFPKVIESSKKMSISKTTHMIVRFVTQKMKKIGMKITSINSMFICIVIHTYICMYVAGVI
ncbi:hypothetical protein TPHA_0A04580 [Tetrapisispora phaffii CBS 4417]|uniref:Uncharacterized protein n=1 Tax=Tetrapisispora phaffii (strain ATCC 24235 / CBS 4417 / NBRC 1672 / NRRL Y-8282 / UCD 70-5) TaxID=1071381 RepID=G8BNQ3_TETPH|nr:hypothetical protein TPHA_0A04580 [Tetrapisispora phaffii CBS 4417]CCE61531.1 hypothetical protein TPHA_0A04580 [Tetrapisispora phaffii CBS 4417]